MEKTSKLQSGRKYLQHKKLTNVLNLNGIKHTHTTIMEICRKDLKRLLKCKNLSDLEKCKTAFSSVQNNLKSSNEIQMIVSHDIHLLFSLQKYLLGLTGRGCRIVLLTIATQRKQLKCSQTGKQISKFYHMKYWDTIHKLHSNKTTYINIYLEVQQYLLHDSFYLGFKTRKKKKKRKLRFEMQIRSKTIGSKTLKEKK